MIDALIVKAGQRMLERIQTFVSLWSDMVEDGKHCLVGMVQGRAFARCMISHGMSTAKDMSEYLNQFSSEKVGYAF